MCIILLYYGIVRMDGMTSSDMYDMAVLWHPVDGPSKRPSQTLKRFIKQTEST